MKQQREPQEYPEKLAEQLRFIERSCRHFDEGDPSEAVRIAVSIRVLVHDTRNSTSLLEHLGAKDQVRLLTTLSKPGPPPPGMAAIEFLPGLVVLAYGPGSANLSAPLERADRRDYVPFDEWWAEVVWSPEPGLTISRRDLILTAADQDGGAHVDSDLELAYSALARAGSIGSWSSDDTELSISFAPASLKTGAVAWSAPVKGGQPLSDAHRHSIRQIGYEILNSPDLQALSA